MLISRGNNNSEKFIDIAASPELMVRFWLWKPERGYIPSIGIWDNSEYKGEWILH